MYVGIDVGGTKTLVAVLSEGGEILEHEKFPTPKDYDDFLTQLDQTLTNFMHHDFKAGAVGFPATVFDRKNGVGVKFGNLPWENVPIQVDTERICGCPMAVDNDAKLAALSEAMLLKSKYNKVLYVTISTGIGLGLVVDGKIDISIGDGGGRMIMLEHHGKTMPWEEFAGGRAIAEHYGKPAHDITDDKDWHTICHNLAKGFIHLIALIQPDAIVIGGSVGTYFDRYGKILADEIKAYEIPLVKLPDLREAQRPEEAVVYGAYDLAKQIYDDA